MKLSEMFDDAAIRDDCNRLFGTLGRPCTWPQCSCLSIPEKHFKPGDYGRGPAMEVLDELKQGQRATDQEIEDDLRDQLANGDC